jgi:hypothetical protein
MKPCKFFEEKDPELPRETDELLDCFRCWNQLKKDCPYHMKGHKPKKGKGKRYEQ